MDRYIAWPGQALGYKLGQLKILELRQRAQTELGPKFDIRAFHDEVLNAGALPLDVLETRIVAWIATVKERPIATMPVEDLIWPCRLRTFANGSNGSTAVLGEEIRATGA